MDKIIKDNNIIIIDNNDFNLKDDLNNAQIYILKNNINNKVYVGKANCFTGINNSIWGTLGRWKSHVNEACKIGKDHCALLNNAIRKYGENNFDILTIYKGPISTIGDYEDLYIKMFNSLVPNGYNLKDGGDNGKLSTETIKKMSDSKSGIELPEKTKENISKGQIGNRRNTKVRKYEEDNDLPKYIIAKRDKGVIKGYMICNFPIGIDKKEYVPDISFSISKYSTKEKAFEATIQKLEELKEEYKHVETDIITLKESNLKESILDKKEQMVKSKLPEYIYPIIEESKIKGYYVEGLNNNNNIPFPKRIFIDNTNRWNLDQANKYLDILKYINENNINMDLFNIQEIDINSIEKSFYEKYYLPKYLNVRILNSKIIGFCINGFPDNNYKNGKFTKEFRMGSKKTFDQVYIEGVLYLQNLNKKL
jgi:hypothetical protein